MVTFVLLLSYRGSYKGMVGPFAEEDDAAGWAARNAPSRDGWSWDVEPLVGPEHLANHEPAPRPVLRVVS